MCIKYACRLSECPMPAAASASAVYYSAQSACNYWIAVNGRMQWDMCTHNTTHTLRSNKLSKWMHDIIGKSQTIKPLNFIIIMHICICGHAIRLHHHSDIDSNNCLHTAVPWPYTTLVNILSLGDPLQPYSQLNSFVWFSYAYFVDSVILSEVQGTI